MTGPRDIPAEPDAAALNARPDCLAPILSLIHERDAALARAERAEAERDRLTKVLREFTEWVERDRREPDKILCHVASMRRALFDVTTDARVDAAPCPTCGGMGAHDAEGNPTTAYTGRECTECGGTGARADAAREET